MALGGGTYVIWPPSSGGGGGGSGATTVGSMDAQAASAFGGVIVGNTLYLQSATATAPGLVNNTTQVWTGQKTIGGNIVSSAQLFLAAGTVSAPSMAFSTLPASGYYVLGSGDVGFSMAGQLATEMFQIGSQTNFGFGGAASQVVTNPCTYYANYNGLVNYQYQNFNTGSASAVKFQILAGGANVNNVTSIENWAGLLSGYLAGGSALFAGPFQSQLNIGVEDTSANSYIAFNVNGRSLATEKVRLNPGNFTLNGGVQLIMIGTSSSGLTLTQNAASSGTSFSVTWPGPGTANGQALVWNAGGVLSWNGTANATAGQLVLRDSNGAAAALNFVSQTTTTQSSGTLNIQLTAASTRIQKVIGSNSIAGGVVLPIATNLYAGEIFELNNNTNQSINIFNTGSTSITTAPGGSYAYLICTDNTTTNGLWDVHWLSPSTIAQTSSVGGATYTVSWPGTQGSSTASALVNIGNGQMAWYPTRGNSVQTFSSGSGIYTPSPGVVSIKITVIGGGGGSGGNALTIGTNSSVAGGGGGAATAVKWISLASLSSSYAYTIADGGAGGTAGANTGSIGTTSLFYSVGSAVAVYAVGGSGGLGANAYSPATTASPGLGMGGAGGATAVGDIIVPGGAGGYGATMVGATGTTAQPRAIGGGGGSSMLAPFSFPTTSNLNVSAAAVNGIGYGGGGIAGYTIGSGGAAQAGSKGSPGVVIVEEFYF